MSANAEQNSLLDEPLQEHSPDLEEEKRNPAFEAKKYVPIYVALMVPLAVSLRINQMTQSAHTHLGTPLILVTKGILYIPCTVMTLFYPFRNFIQRKQPEHPVLASFALRLLLLLLCFVFTLYELSFICTREDRDISKDSDEHCSIGITVERIIMGTNFVGLGFFVVFNNHYPRESRLHLFFLAHICSLCLFVYIVNMVHDEMYIYESINSVRFNTESVFNPYKEVMSVLICEATIVILSIAIGIIVQIGSHIRREPNVVHSWRLMILWTIIVIFSVLLQWILISGLVREEPIVDPKIMRWIFLGIKITTFTIGIGVCLFLLKSGRTRDEITSSEVVDRSLLYFGMVGILFYACVNITNCILYLQPPFFYPKLVMHVLSIAQIVFQSITLLHCNMINNRNVFLTGTVLWWVNFVAFSLDLFDTASAGRYSNPIRQESNIYWTMFVLGLTPLDVFYRFHSQALIAESVEEHLSERREATEDEERLIE